MHTLLPRRLALAVFLAVGMAPLSSPQAAALTPGAAFDMALQQTPELVASRARVAEAKGAVSESKGHLLPKLGLDVNAATSNNPLDVFGMKLQQRQATFNDFGAGQFLEGINDPGIVDQPVDNLNHPGWHQNFQTQLQLQVPIYNGGQVWAGVHRAEAMLAAAQQGQEAARQQVLFQVVRLFEGIRTAEGYQAAAGKGIEAARAFVDLTEKLYDKGVVDKSDLLRARVHLGDAKLAAAEAEKQRAVTEEGLRVLIGSADGAPLELAPGHVALPRPEGENGQLAQQAMDGNPGLHALGEQVQAAQAGVGEAQAAYKPHVNLMLSHAWNDEHLKLDNESNTAALVVHWDLLDFGSRGGALDRAQAKVIEQQGKLEKARNELRVKVRGALEDVHLAATRIEVKQAAVADATEAARLARLRYAKGVDTFAQLLDAQAELDKARADLVSARYRQVMARAGLLLALGRLESSAVSLADSQAGA